MRAQPNQPPGGEAMTRAAALADLTRAEALAEQKRKRALIALTALVAVLAVAVVAAFGLIFVRTAANEAADAAVPPAECHLQSLRITADPMIAGALEDVVAESAASGADCSEVTVRSEDSALTAASLAAGAAPEFDVWVPDSAIWATRVAGDAQLAGVEAPDLVVGPVVASTPVVLAATESGAAALEAAGGGLSSLAGGSIVPVLPDPSTAASSSAALHALQAAVDEDSRAFTALVLALEAGLVPTASDALAAASSATTPTVALTTEQAVLRGGGGPAALVAVRPTDGSPAVGAPLVTLAGAKDDTGDAVAALADSIASRSGVLAAHGLRDAAGNPLDPSDAEVVAAPDAAQVANQAEALGTWRVLTAPSRILALADVSGSMLQTAPNQMRRIELFEQAAVRAVNSLSESSSMAIWVFSSLRDGDRDWQEVVPFGSLGDPDHKQRVLGAADSLDSLVVGGTGLYDSVLAAVKHMHDTYVPGYANVVLLNTDGVNEDDDGMDLATLLTELEKLRNPAEPVAVIAVGYGPDTDQSVLEQIAAATGGAAYQALQPEDISTVLIDAVTQRGCRPSCS